MRSWSVDYDEGNLRWWCFFPRCATVVCLALAPPVSWMLTWCSGLCSASRSSCTLFPIMLFVQNHRILCVFQQAFGHRPGSGGKCKSVRVTRRPRFSSLFLSRALAAERFHAESDSSSRKGVTGVFLAYRTRSRIHLRVTASLQWFNRNCEVRRRVCDVCAKPRPSF